MVVRFPEGSTESKSTTGVSPFTMLTSSSRYGTAAQRSPRSKVFCDLRGDDNAPSLTTPAGAGPTKPRRRRRPDLRHLHPEPRKLIGRPSRHRRDWPARDSAREPRAATASETMPAAARFERVTALGRAEAPDLARSSGMERPTADDAMSNKIVDAKVESSGAKARTPDIKW